MQAAVGGGAEALPPGTLETVVTHLAMDAAPAGPPPALPGIAFRPRPDLSCDSYLRLYRAIGDDWLWWGRLVLDSDALAAHLRAPETLVHLAEAAGGPVGLAELDLRPAPDIELRYFGVLPARIGTGLGGYMLAHVLEAAWRRRPRRVILNSCTFDHPGAVGFYEKHGFRVTRTERQTFPDPRLTGLLPRHAAPHIPLASRAAE